MDWALGGVEDDAYFVNKHEHIILIDMADPS
jgi:hypothetical protein